jgi:cytochrome d ubiquinol oxidase subunit II
VVSESTNFRVGVNNGILDWYTVLTRVVALVTHIRPGILANFNKWPVGYLIPIVVAGSLIYLFVALRSKNDKGAFLASCGYIVGMLVGAEVALYPNMLPASTDPNLSLTIYNTATGPHEM